MTQPLLSIPETIVGADGAGDHRTIAAAIAASSDGARIWVEPGTYLENVTLDRDVEIIARGKPGEVVLLGERDDVPTVHATAAFARLKGIWINSQCESELGAVYVERGQLVIEHCTVETVGAAIVIRGADADPVVRQCTLRSPGAAAITVAREARGVIEDCTIEGSGDPAALLVTERADPLVQHTTIRGASATGLAVSYGASGTYRACHIAGSGGIGIEITHEADPSIAGCEVVDNQSGIRVDFHGRGRIASTRIAESKEENFWALRGGAPQILSCHIDGARGFGVMSTDDGAAKLTDCDIVGSGKANFATARGGTAQLEGCRLREGEGSAIYIHDGGQARLKRCTISAPGMSGIVVEKGAIEANACAIEDTQATGLRITDSKGSVLDCRIVRSGHNGVTIEGASTDVQVKRCQVIDAKQFGIRLAEGAAGMIEECDVEGAQLSAFYVTQTTAARFVACRAKKSGQCGLYVSDQGSGRFDRCQFLYSGYSGVDVRDGGTPELHECRIRDSRQAGVRIVGAAGVFVDCVIAENYASGVEVSKGGTPSVRRCHLADNGRFGIETKDGGRGDFVGCTTEGNSRGHHEVTPETTIRAETPAAE